MDTFPRTAVYPGSFDPPTKGHLDVLKRATGLFDRVVVGIGRNPEKDSLRAAEERVELMAALRPEGVDVLVEAYEGLTVDFAKKHRAVAAHSWVSNHVGRGKRMPIGYRQPHRGRLGNGSHGRGSRARLHQQSFDSRSRRPRRRLGSPACVCARGGP